MASARPRPSASLRFLPVLGGQKSSSKAPWVGKPLVKAPRLLEHGAIFVHALTNETHVQLGPLACTLAKRGRAPAGHRLLLRASDCEGIGSKAFEHEAAETGAKEPKTNDLDVWALVVSVGIRRHDGQQEGTLPCGLC